MPPVSLARRRHSVPVWAYGCRSATWFENPRIPRFTPDTRGVPPQCCLAQNYHCWLLLVILGRFRDPRKRAKKGLFLGVSKTTLFFMFFGFLTSLLHHQLFINSSSTHHFIINFTHHITSYNSSTLQRPQKHDFGTPKTPLFWPLKNTPFLTPKTLFFVIIKIIIINVINTSSETSKITFFSFFNFFKNRKLFFKSAN